MAFSWSVRPDETERTSWRASVSAARLKLDTFGFNRLCVYRGTPLWKEYVERGIIDDERDWDKWFKCSDIDPTVLPGETVNRARQKGYALLFARRMFFRPIQTFKLLRTLGRHMKVSDILKLLSSPFRRRTLEPKAGVAGPDAGAGIDRPGSGCRRAGRPSAGLRADATPPAPFHRAEAERPPDSWQVLICSPACRLHPPQTAFPPPARAGLYVLFTQSPLRGPTWRA